jgi:LacI family transcriptional regulator
LRRITPLVERLPASEEKGVQRFAFYGLPTSSGKRWAVEREHAFCQLVAKEKYRGVVYQGLETAPENWQHAQNRLADWLQTLPANRNHRRDRCPRPSRAPGVRPLHIPVPENCA